MAREKKYVKIDSKNAENGEVYGKATVQKLDQVLDELIKEN